MAEAFGETSTTEDVLAVLNLKVCGFSSRAFQPGWVEMGGRLLRTARRVVGARATWSRPKAGAEQVRQDAENQRWIVRTDRNSNLADLKSVRACADALLVKVNRST